MRPFFVAGTDTGVGKTVFTLRWLRFAAEIGLSPSAFKPVASGVEPVGGRILNPDVAALAAAQGRAPGEVNFVTWERPLAPLAAARLEGREPDPAPLLEWCRARIAPDTAFEGVGGLFVPLARGWHVLDLICELALPAVLVARSGLGTVNHTLLSARALLESGTEVAGVVLSRENDPLDEAAVTGFDLLCRELSPLPVLVLPHLSVGEPLQPPEREAFERLASVLS